MDSCPTACPRLTFAVGGKAGSSWLNRGVTETQGLYFKATTEHASMVKQKSARLSLTMLEPTRSQSHPSSTDQRDQLEEPKHSAERTTSDHESRSKSRSAKRDQERGRRESRSSSPVITPLSATERPKSPKSPSSPGFTSLPPFPASPTTASKHGRDHSKSFFSNLKASKSSAKIQPIEPTIRKVQQDTSQTEDASRKPARTKSTPDLRGASVAEAVPDLPSLDVNSSLCKSGLQNKVVIWNS